MRFRLSFSRARAGVLAPLVVAVTLAVVGHDVSTPDASLAMPAEAIAPAKQLRNNAVTRAPAKKRASRAQVRKPVRKPAWVRPSRGRVTSGYGPRWGRMHRGLDFGAAYGTPIYAASNGVVSFAGAQSGYGRLVTVRHKHGYTTAYGHMSRIVVRYGQRVSAGQVIAYTGSAGRSTGPHLHFEVRRGSAFVNPLRFLRRVGVRV